MNISESNVRKIVREELMKLMEQDEAKAPSIDDLDFMSDERAEYERWASRHGHVSAEVRSVFVDYLLANELTSNEDLRKKLSKEIGFDDAAVLDDVMKRQSSEEVDPATEESSRELSLAQVVEAISEL